MGGPAGYTFVGTGEGSRALLYEITLFGVLPVRSVKHQRRRPAGSLLSGVNGQLGRVGALGHFGRRGIKALHEVVDIRLHTRSGLENDDLDAFRTQFMGD